MIGLTHSGHTLAEGLPVPSTIARYSLQAQLTTNSLQLVHANAIAQKPEDRGLFPVRIVEGLQVAPSVGPAQGVTGFAADVAPGKGEHVEGIKPVAGSACEPQLVDPRSADL
jgi:hypothetical protein